MTQFVAVIDLGKTNSKVALVDTRTATEVRVVAQPSAVDLSSIYPSLDHLAIKSFIIESLASLAATHSIDAITVTTHGATAALINASGELALPVLDYEYPEIETLRSDYDKHRPLFSETGSPALPGGLNIGAQLYWQQSNFTQQFANAQTMLTWPQYWVHWLTGKRYNDVSSLGCHTDLYVPRRQSYSSLVSAMGWSTLMPPVKNSGELCGALTPSVVKQLGLTSAVPVYTGIHDSNASLVPHLLAHEAPYSVVSTGTWFIVMAIGGGPVKLDETRDTLLNVNALGGCVPSARFMGGRERSLLTTTSQACEASLSELLSNYSDPLMLMPSMVSGTGPYPRAESRWVGASAEHSGAVRDSAIALYLALMTYESMKLVGSSGPTFIEGPLAHDQQFAQMLSALSKSDVYISGAQTGTSVGAAMLISAPTKPPVYDMIDIGSKTRDELICYAYLWRKKLSDHAR